MADTHGDKMGYLLAPLGKVYGEVMRVRNYFYDRGWMKTRWLEAPVISVGNLTVGGTGKTPTVAMIGKMVAAAGKRPGVIMRGYGRRAGRESDEVLLLRRALGEGAAVVANPDRIAGSREAIERFGAQVLIADDGFQHRRLGRDLDICLVDGSFPFGGNRVLPAGRLREPMEGLERADVVIMTRSDQVSEEELETIQAKIREYTEVPILRSRHRVCGFTDLAGRRYSEIRGRKVFAFSGIGRNESFFQTVRETGAEVVGTRGFADHHYFTTKELREIRDEASRCGAELAVCTVKDLVRIETTKVDIEPEKILAVEIEISMAEEDEEILREKIEEQCKMQIANIKMQN
jgi:tetraacyldisaccharide 4'-kinase